MELGKTLSYTATQETQIRNSAPVNKEIAEKLASKFGVSTRSVISKTISMKVPYVKEERKASAPVVRKASVVKQIETALGIKCESLVNAKATDLATLFNAVK